MNRTFEHCQWDRAHLGQNSLLCLVRIGLLAVFLVQLAACVSVERRPAAWGENTAPVNADGCPPIEGAYRNVGESAHGARTFLAEEVYFFQASDAAITNDTRTKLLDDLAAAETVAFSVAQDSPLHVEIRGNGISRSRMFERSRFNCHDGILTIESTGPVGDDIFTGIENSKLELQRAGDFLLINPRGAFGAILRFPVLPIALAGYGSSWLRFERVPEAPAALAPASLPEKIAEPQPDRIARLVDSLRQQMVSIPAGSFLMGGGHSPLHDVQISAFRLSAHELTYEAYELFVTSTGRNLSADPAWAEGSGKPAINVSWEDAKAFIEWINEQSGLKFRLPSEAEWEYAARAGTTTPYPWGEKFRNDKANGDSRAPSGPDLWISTAPNGSFPPNPWGLYDMVGNVWEWTDDCLDIQEHAGPAADGSAWLKGNCTFRAARGGGWNSFSWAPFGLSTNVPVYERILRKTTERNTNQGLRLALDSPGPSVLDGH